MLEIIADLNARLLQYKIEEPRYGQIIETQHNIKL